MPRKKTYTDKNGYNRYSNLVHRQKAYRYIYLKNREEYPLPFSKYVVHHIDGDKLNNAVDNLQLMIKEEHEELYGYDSGGILTFFEIIIRCLLYYFIFIAVITFILAVIIFGYIYITNYENISFWRYIQLLFIELIRWIK